MELESRIKGGLYGVAIGDALGGTTEFMSREAVRSRYNYLTDIIGGGVWELEAGEVTDDTMMTLCVAEGILDQPSAPIDAIGRQFLQWHQSDPKDIGNIIRQVFRNYKGDWYAAAELAHKHLGQSAGNGSLMRCLPVALSYTKLSEVNNISRLQSKMTHYDERSSEACEMYNRIVFRMINEQAALQDAVRLEVQATAYEETWTTEPDCEPSGFVVDTFRWVLYIVMTSQSFSEVVQKAANFGGDSDTIAAIAGGLAGVHYGYDQIPKSYAERILIKDRLEMVSRKIVELRHDRGMEESFNNEG